MRGRKMVAIIKHTMHYRRVIITLQPGYSFYKKIWISECCYSGYVMCLNFNNCTTLIKFCRLLFLFWLLYHFALFLFYHFIFIYAVLICFMCMYSGAKFMMSIMMRKWS